jgi:cytochrome d ubiquinol oxidase subunit I
VLVASGAALSGLWIIIANSWMQTPAGFEIQGTGAAAKAVLTDPMAALFNASTLPRYLHTITSSWALAGFLVLGVGAWLMRHGRAGDVARLSIRVGLVVAIIGTIGVLGSGDTSARQVANTQPAKFAAMQGLYDTTVGAPLVLWSLPPSQDQANAVEGPAILVTRLLSFLSFGDFKAAVTGLNEFPKIDWPPVAASFLAYHNMVVLGTLMAILLVSGVYLAWRRRLDRSDRWLGFATWGFVLPFLAIQLGWTTAEVGRQPWIVYGVMRTADATSPVVSASEILFSIVLFGAVYLLLGGLWLWLMARAIRQGPVQEPLPEEYGVDVSIRLPGLRVEAH